MKQSSVTDAADLETLAELADDVEAIESGEKRVIDRETELEAARHLFNEEFTAAFLAEEIEAVRFIPDENLGVMAVTDNFVVRAKRNTREGDHGIVYAKITASNGVTYREVNAECCERVTDAFKGRI